MKQDIVFESVLEEAMAQLTEASMPMSKAQKEKVKKMQASGWKILKKKDGKVIMTKGDKEVFVYDSGKTFFITEGQELDVTSFAEILFEDEEKDQELTEAVNQMIEEGYIDRVIQKGLERYPMMFLEKNGDHRFFFVKTRAGGTEWVEFKGNTLEDKGTFQNDKEGEEFIQSKLDEGFKAIKQDGGIKRFIKGIGRGIAALLKAYGIVGSVSVVLAILVMIFLPGLVAGFGIASSTVGTVIGVNTGVAFTSFGSGWLIGKLSEKKPQVAGGDDNEELNVRS